METGTSRGIAILRSKAPCMLIVLAVIALVSLGLVVLSSVTQAYVPVGSNLFLKQIVWLILGLVAATSVAFLDLNRVRRFVWPFAAVSLALLILVIIPGIGVSVNGARRWLDLGPINLQVSDLAKIALVFVLAHYLAVNQRKLQQFVPGFVVPCGMICMAFLFIMVEPDFGTALLVAVVGFSLLFISGVRLMYLIPTVLLGSALFAVAVYLDPVRWRRVTAFMDVDANRSDGTYQLWQGLLAFGAGGPFGVGLGNGRQQMDFLPEAHTDFIFPILGEELGVFFSVGVVFLFLLIFLAGVWQLNRAPTLFYYLLVTGALLVITLQALVNLGVVTGCLPTKGMSLPFLSYGGSNLVTMFVFVGIILSCSRRWSRTPLARPVEL